MFFDYEKMLQDRFRSLVLEVLKHVENEGLPSGHHFFITFRTDHPKLLLPDYLAEENPDEMTVVLQHQFWDLEVNEKGFRVVLSFDGSNHEIYIPFDALIAFVDPYADFGLEFSPVFSNDNNDHEPDPDPSLKLVDKPKSEGNIVTVDFTKKK